MKTITTAEVVSAIARAYRGAVACHCEGDGNVTEKQLFAALVADGVIELNETPAHHPLSVEVLYRAGAVPTDVWWACQHDWGIAFLSQFSTWKRQELMRGRGGWGEKKMRKLELFLARHGILLADGNPALLEEAKHLDVHGEEPVDLDAMKREAATPAAIRQRGVDSLMELSEELHARSQSLFKLARLVETENRKAIGSLRRYVSGGYIGAPTVAAIAEPLSRLHEQEKQARKQPAATDKPALRLVANG